jgi:transposase
LRFVHWWSSEGIVEKLLPRLEDYFEYGQRVWMSPIKQRTTKMRKKKNAKKKGSPINPVKPLMQIRANAAGIDIGTETLYACVPQDRDAEFVQTYSTFTAGIHAMAEWFKRCRIDTIAMEATGVYWIPVYDILETYGFEVFLISPESRKRRKKTDVLDCQDIQQMHSYGLLENSFRPSEQIREWRSYVRLRERILQAMSTDILHMQKAFHQMNIQLDNVISDLTGVTGMAIIKAILGGERDPEVLANLRNPGCKSSKEIIAQSLVGNYRKEFLFELRQAVESYEFHNNHLNQCHAEIQEVLARFADRSTKPLGPSQKKTRNKKNVPNYDLREYLHSICGVDLTAVSGLNILTVQSLLSEVGVDLIKSFPTYKHFQSWLGTAPNRRISGKKVISSRTFKPNRAAVCLFLAAQSLLNSETPLGDKFRRLRARLGPQKAKIAMANNLARIIYVMITKQVEFDQTLHAAHHQENLQRAKRHLERKAAAIGCMIVPMKNVTSKSQESSTSHP